MRNGIHHQNLNPNSTMSPSHLSGNTVPSSTSSKQDKLKRNHIKIAEQVFDRLALIYGHAWTTLLKGKVWNACLMSEWSEVIALMSEEEIQLAFRYLKSKNNKKHIDFPPNALQFLNLPKLIKETEIPSEMECYQAALNSRWDLHPIVKTAAQWCDLYWLKRASDTEARKRFSRCYAIVKEKYLRGEDLTEKTALLALNPKTVSII